VKGSNGSRAGGRGAGAVAPAQGPLGCAAARATVITPNGRAASLGNQLSSRDLEHLYQKFTQIKVFQATLAL